MQDNEGEEIPKAFVVKQQGAEDLTEDEVMTYVAERIAPHKKVRRVEFIDVDAEVGLGQDPAQGPAGAGGREGLTSAAERRSAPTP